MIAVAVLLVLAIGPLLVPDLRGEPLIWIFSGVLIVLAVAITTVGHPRSAILTARQVKFARWWGYTSHDGRGERDVREKRGE